MAGQPKGVPSFAGLNDDERLGGQTKGLRFHTGLSEFRGLTELLATD
jgi:hypothetical protein